MDCPLFKSSMLSKLVQCSGSNLLTVLAKKSLYKLIVSKPNSSHGVSTVANAPECNDCILNIKLPAVFRQYSGMNIDDETENIIQHVAYRSQLTISSEGSNPGN